MGSDAEGSKRLREAARELVKEQRYLAMVPSKAATLLKGTMIQNPVLGFGSFLGESPASHCWHNCNQSCI